MPASYPECIEENIALHDYTTLNVGGAARFFARPRSIEEIQEVLAWAKSQSLALFILGGGSNTLVSDTGFSGVVLSLARCLELGGWTLQPEAEGAHAKVGAAVVWDDWVGHCVAQGLAGITCLSGIPGHVGAAPIQNIGAYGQEVSEVLTAVEVMDLGDGSIQTYRADDCGLGYRQSNFKGEWHGRYLVLWVHMRLRHDSTEPLRYPSLSSTLSPKPSLAEVRATVLALRRSKSMVYDPQDPNHKSAGSFFMNPVITNTNLEGLKQSLGADLTEKMPAYDASPGKTKLSAAWLMEQAGFGKGYVKGQAGLSSNHCLGVINRGDASADDIVALASEIQRGVKERFGVTLMPEPVFLGFEKPVAQLLQEFAHK